MIGPNIHTFNAVTNMNTGVAGSSSNDAAPNQPGVEVRLNAHSLHAIFRHGLLVITYCPELPELHTPYRPIPAVQQIRSPQAMRL